MLKETINIFLLVCLVTGLVFYLYRRKTPRAIFLGAIFFSAWIFFIGFWMAKGALDQLNSDLETSIVPYLVAAVPVAVFIKWFLAGTKTAKK